MFRLQIMKPKGKNERRYSDNFAQILPKYKINPFMQKCRRVLTLKSHLMLMDKISSIFSPRRKFDRIWKSVFNHSKYFNSVTSNHVSLTSLKYETYRAFHPTVSCQSQLNFHWLRSQEDKRAQEPKPDKKPPPPKC